MNESYFLRERDACGIGTVVNIDGTKEYGVLDDALHIVEKLDHRAGKDATGKVGDGVGILTQISHGFFKAAAAKEEIALGEEGEYGIGMLFLPRDTRKRMFAMRMMEVIVRKAQMPFLGWRKVPVRPQILGERAVECMPSIWQCFIGKPEHTQKGIEFDRRLYVVRREFEQSSEDTYICSMSSRTIVYKGMFLVNQLREFYCDLQDHAYRTQWGDQYDPRQYGPYAGQGRDDEVTVPAGGPGQDLPGDHTDGIRFRDAG